MRVFLAIVLPYSKRLEEIRRKLKGEGVKVTKDNHITLIFFGEKSEREVEEIKKKMEVAKGFGPFKIRLSGIGFFPNEKRPRVVWVGVKSSRIYDLWALLVNVLDHADKPFVPHLTLARIKKPRRIEIKENIDEEYEVEAIHLIKSVLTREGPIYEKLYSVML